MKQPERTACIAEDCQLIAPRGDMFCPECWGKLPKEVRRFLLEEQKKARRHGKGYPAKRWETTVLEALDHLHGLDLDESLEWAKPLALTKDKTLLGKLADQVLGRVKDAAGFVVVVRPDAPEAPVVEGVRVFVRDIEALRSLLVDA